MKRKTRRVFRVAALFYLKPYIVVCLRQAFINEAEDMLNSATLGLGRMDFSNTPSGHTPSVIGTQEVYRYGTAPNLPTVSVSDPDLDPHSLRRLDPDPAW